MHTHWRRPRSGGATRETPFGPWLKHAGPRGRHAVAPHARARGNPAGCRRRRARSIRAMTLVTAESVHRTPVLDLAGCWSEDQRHGLLLGQVRCGGEAPLPPGRTPCAKIGPSRTARRGGTSSWACVRLRRSRTPRPSPRHAVHVGSRTIARQAGGTPRGTARPHVESRLRSAYMGPPTRRGCETLHPTTARDPGDPRRSHRAVPWNPSANSFPLRLVT